MNIIYFPIITTFFVIILLALRSLFSYKYSEKTPEVIRTPQVSSPETTLEDLASPEVIRTPQVSAPETTLIKQALIERGIISANEYSSLEDLASPRSLAFMPKINEPVLRDLLLNGNITPRQAIFMDYIQIRALNDRDIKQRFIDGDYQLEFLGVPYAQLLYDREPGTRSTLITWARSSYSSYCAMSEGGLNLINIQRLLAQGYIPLERLSRLRYSEIHALNDNYNRIVSGAITIDRLLSGNDNDCINTAQSTHTASVHKSVSKSATKLSKKYKINNIRKELTVIQNRVEKEGNEIHKRCIKRITAPDYIFRDNSSQLSFQQALCLAYKALEGCTAPEPEMFKHFLNALYEIQRCYNLDSKGNEIDVNAPDSVMCVSGSFNKIISFLWGFHPLVEIIYISKANASTKLQAVVEQALQNNPDKTYEEIRPQIEERMQEYRSAFSRETEFQEFIDAGEYIEPKKQLTNSN